MSSIFLVTIVPPAKFTADRPTVVAKKKKKMHELHDLIRTKT